MKTKLLNQQETPAKSKISDVSLGEVFASTLFLFRPYIQVFGRSLLTLS